MGTGAELVEFDRAASLVATEFAGNDQLHQLDRFGKEERAGSRHVIAADIGGDIGGDDDRIDLTDHGGRIFHDVPDVRAEGHVFGAELAIAGAANVGHYRSGNGERFGVFLVQVGGDAGVGTFPRHQVAIIAVEHGAPRIRMSIPWRGAEDGQSDLVRLFDDCHGAGRRSGYSTLRESFPVWYSLSQILIFEAI